ncbi:MAG: lamin tail domain-containing protein [Bacteroidales bacterium]|nr:lamin tail domain-containing protein [Bacteroidales bacterium]MDY0285988.1 lamin tail domain-containing protein [Bacteroidales bacterium]
MKQTILLLFLILQTLLAISQNAWINEIHYDNIGTDVDETVEIVIENSAIYSLSDFAVTLYNGADGESYSTITLDQYTSGASVEGFSFFYSNYTANGFSIQNGNPDGIALSWQGILIPGQFISYGGVFTATNGPAAGESSTDISVSEPGEIGESLQLTGNGTTYSNFSWQPPTIATPGAANPAQTFGTIAPDPEPENHVTDFTVTDSTWFSLQLQWTDATGFPLPSGYLIKFSVLSHENIIAPTDGIPQINNDSALNIPYGIEATLFYSLMANTTHYFKIWPYSNSGAEIDYKLDNPVPALQATTLPAPPFINHETFENGNVGTWSTFSLASDKDWTVTQVIPGATGTAWSAQINGFQENEPSNDWLISPPLNLYNVSDQKMCFYSQWKYGTTMEELSLNYSTDYTGGNPGEATWTELSFTKPVNAEEWAFSDTVHLEMLTDSNTYLAFHYLSNGSPRRWNVDEIQISGINFPGITVVSPETGAQWITGTTETITWIADSAITAVDLFITLHATDPEPAWIVLADSVPAETASHDWSIPNDFSTSSDCQIKIKNHNGLSEGLSGIFCLSPSPYLPQLVINEIMYNPPESIGADDNFEFIELYNNDTASITLSGYSLEGDANFQFPDELVITPGEYLIIASNPDSISEYYGINEVLGPYTGQLSNSGGIVRIKNSNAQIIDLVNYAANEPWPGQPNGGGPSLELIAPTLDNSIASSWLASLVTGGTPGALNSSVSEIENIVLSEIFYNPPGENFESIEFIELYNANSGPVNLGGCSFTQGIEFIFPSVIVQSGDYLVITRDVAAFINIFGIPAFQWTSGELGNALDTLEMNDVLGNIIDFVPYQSTQPWDTLAGGHGHSLELIAPALNNTSPENWMASNTFNTVLNGIDSVWCSPYAGFSIAPPQADFSADTTTIFASQTITFNSLSTGEINFYAWSFSGGTPDSTNETIPHITYHIPGTYNVSLFISGPYGEDTETKTGYITVLPIPDPPIADFEAGQTTLYVGDSIYFHDLSINTPTSWEWTFEGALPGSSSVQNPTNIKYTTPGNFDVSLTVSNFSGQNQRIKENYIIVLDTTRYAVLITEIMYNPPETDTDSLEFVELYNNEDHPVKLEGYYFKGFDYTFPAVDMNPGEYLVLAANPTAVFNTFGIASLPFNSGFLDNNGEEIALYTPNGLLMDSVQYNDQPPWPTAADGEGPSLVFCNTYLDNSLPESWSASLDFAAINDNNDTLWASPGAPCGIMPSPLADFYGEPTAGGPGLTVQFFDQSTHNPGSWLWAFPGGIPDLSTQQNPVILYPQAGDFDVSLTVTNLFGSNLLTKSAYIQIATGLKNQKDYQITVFPNPSGSGIFTITLNSNNQKLIQVFAVDGKEIKNFSTHETTILLNLSAEKTNGFFLKITDLQTHRSYYKKLIIN